MSNLLVILSKRYEANTLLGAKTPNTLLCVFVEELSDYYHVNILRGIVNQNSSLIYSATPLLI
jgi:hypothetical protein